MLERPRIIDVLRKPSKCPVCKSEVWDIIYGTGDMTEIEFFLEYGKSAIMGGDIIPRRPPIWACSCGCKRFRKVNPDGTDAPVKVKMLKDVRRAPLRNDPENWEPAGNESELAARVMEMELRYDELTRVMGNLETAVLEYKAFKEDLDALRNYMASGQWKKDFEADEAGEVPSRIKRGVLSEDGLYDFLQGADEILAQTKEVLG